MSKLPEASGTYALLLAPSAPTEMEVGRLGRIRFDSPLYLYVGSAFGPGGLAARLRHHLGDAARPHWHIDYLRAVARVHSVWITQDSRRMECAWREAAVRMRGACAIEGFGSSDCRCPSHLIAVKGVPTRSAFRRLLPPEARDCARIQAWLP